MVAGLGRLGLGRELGELGVEIGLVLPDRGNAAVSPPVLELSGNSGFALSASANVANTFFAASRLNGRLPSIMSVAIRFWSPFAFIMALRAAIGSLCATKAVAPNASTATASTVRIISACSLSLDWFPRRPARMGGQQTNTAI